MTYILRPPQFDKREEHKSLEPFTEVKAFYDKKIDPLIHSLLEESLDDCVKYSIRKYLAVAIFAAMDFFFRNAVRKMVDHNDLNVTSFILSRLGTKVGKTHSRQYYYKG